MGFAAVIKKLQEERIRKQISDTSLNISKIRKSTIQNILKSDDFFDFLSERFHTDHYGPLVFMARNGYIAEDYRDYLTYFYPGSLTENDKKVTLEISEGKSHTPNTKIDNPEFALKHIAPPELNKNCGLINSLVSELVANSSQTYRSYQAKDYLEELFSDADKDIDDISKYLKQYIESEYDSSSLISKLFIITPKVIVRLLENSSVLFETEEILYITLDALSRRQLDSLSEILSDKSIKEISEIESLDKVYSLTKTKPYIWNWIKKNKFRFKNIKLNRCSQEVALKIINDKIFFINSHMVALLLAFTQEADPRGHAKVSYSALMDSQNESLISSFWSNTEKYIEKVLIIQDRLIEKEEYFIELINSGELEDRTDLKKRL